MLERADGVTPRGAAHDPALLLLVPLEGGRCSEQARADQDAYARGQITVDELIKRAGRASLATDPNA